jgi:hypothetical protein
MGFASQSGLAMIYPERRPGWDGDTRSTSPPTRNGSWPNAQQSHLVAGSIAAPPGLTLLTVTDS